MWYEYYEIQLFLEKHTPIFLATIWTSKGS
jgi:hypothetical protein